MSDSLSPAVEDYLKTILKLSMENGEVHVTDIAKQLKINKASVTQALDKLRGLKLITKVKYGPIKLTEKGKGEALKVIYKHILICNFLVSVLNVPPDVATKEACFLEHLISSQTQTALINFLENNLYEI